jgi:NAD-dependent deacetylase
MTGPRVVVLTGAGISAESGLGTFRDPGGLWEKFDPYELATPEAFARDPEKVHAFYNMRRRDLIASRPNGAHAALAELERGLAAAGGRLTIVTQNIDDLHERAGAERVLHMHGELLTARCTWCAAKEPCREDLDAARACAACARPGGLRPHIVWFGEIPLHMDEIVAALADADAFAAIGTSGSVYPAAGFVMQAKELGARTVELNLEPSDNAYLFDERRYGRASEIVPAWVESVLAAA